MAKEGRVHARGNKRDDGKLFWRYRGKYEQWVTPEVFNRYLNQSSKYNFAYCKENKERIRRRMQMYRERHAEVFHMYEMLYYLANEESEKNYRKEYNAKNKDLLASKMREWRKDNAEEYRKYMIGWRTKNKERLTLLQKKWRQNNPDKTSALSSKRRSRVLNAIPESVWEKGIEGIYQIASRISRCLGIRHHVDHIIPISRGGKHEPNNLQVLPAILNIRKSNNIDYRLPDCYLTPARLMSR
jgi:hypothetical protein